MTPEERAQYSKSNPIGYPLNPFFHRVTGTKAVLYHRSNNEARARCKPDRTRLNIVDGTPISQLQSHELCGVCFVNEIKARS